MESESARDGDGERECERRGWRVRVRETGMESESARDGDGE